MNGSFTATTSTFPDCRAARITRRPIRPNLRSKYKRFKQLAAIHFQIANIEHTIRAKYIFTARNEVGARLCFLHVSVILFTGGGLPQCMLGYHPPEQTPPGTTYPPEQCMLGDTGNKQAVRILLECILVQIHFFSYC